MSVPPSASRLHAPLALLGVLATGLAAAAVVVALLVSDDAARSLDHGREPLALHLLLEGPLPIALALLVGAVVVRAGRVLVRHVRARRRIRPLLVRAHPLAEYVRVLDDPAHQAVAVAFCAGLLRPRVYVSTGALRLLGERELHALLAHELQHAARRDPLRRLVCELLSESLFFLPVMRPLGQRRAALAELRADAAAVDACGGDTRPLAGALLAFERAQGERLRIDPERIDRLGGRRQRPWTPPKPALATALGLLALVLALPVVTVEHVIRHASDTSAASTR